MSHSNRLTRPDEGVIGISGLWLRGQKPRHRFLLLPIDLGDTQLVSRNSLLVWEAPRQWNWSRIQLFLSPNEESFFLTLKLWFIDRWIIIIIMVT